MTWTELVERIADRAGLPRAQVRRVLVALVDECAAAVARGDRVVIRDLVTLDSRWREPSTVRSVGDQRKLRLDGRWVPRVRAARRLRELLAARTTQTWRDPEHQAAWRAAEALIGDLALYHGDRAPLLDPAAPCAEVDAACAERFGPLWARVRATFDARVAPRIREQSDYVALAARTRWARAETTSPTSTPQEQP